jgi:hypothetical protein
MTSFASRGSCAVTAIRRSALPRVVAPTRQSGLTSQRICRTMHMPRALARGSNPGSSPDGERAGLARLREPLASRLRRSRRHVDARFDRPRRPHRIGDPEEGFLGGTHVLVVEPVDRSGVKECRSDRPAVHPIASFPAFDDESSRAHGESRRGLPDAPWRRTEGSADESTHRQTRGFDRRGRVRRARRASVERRAFVVTPRSRFRVSTLVSGSSR